MNTYSPYRVLIFDFILFLSVCIVIWMINIIGQRTFPGNNLFPFLMRSIMLLFTVIFCYYLNYKFIKKNLLPLDLLKFKAGLIKYYLGGILLACFLIATI